MVYSIRVCGFEAGGNTASSPFCSSSSPLKSSRSDWFFPNSLIQILSFYFSINRSIDRPVDCLFVFNSTRKVSDYIEDKKKRTSTVSSSCTYFLLLSSLSTHPSFSSPVTILFCSATKTYSCTNRSSSPISTPPLSKTDHLPLLSRVFLIRSFKHLLQFCLPFCYHLHAHWCNFFRYGRGCKYFLFCSLHVSDTLSSSSLSHIFNCLLIFSSSLEPNPPSYLHSLQVSSSNAVNFFLKWRASVFVDSFIKILLIRLIWQHRLCDWWIDRIRLVGCQNISWSFLFLTSICKVLWSVLFSICSAFIDMHRYYACMRVCVLCDLLPPPLI